MIHHIILCLAGQHAADLLQAHRHEDHAEGEGWWVNMIGFVLDLISTCVVIVSIIVTIIIVVIIIMISSSSSSSS